MTYALGLAGGLAVNTLSNDVGYRGAATAAAIAAILISTNWLRQLSSKAPLTRIVSRALLGGAAIAAVVAAVNPRWEGPATIAATVLTTSAVLIPTELERAIELLAGIACIGMGVAFLGVGVAVVRDGRVLAGVAVIGLGLGLAGLGYGVAFLRDARVLAGAAVIGLGVAWIGLGVAALRDGHVLAGVAVIGLGLAWIGVGVAALRDGRVPAGVAVIGLGLAGLGVGVAVLRDSRVLTGVTVLRDGRVLAGVACHGAAVAVIGYGVVILGRTGIVAHALTWLASLTRDPSSEALHDDDPPVSGPDDPPGTRAPTSKPPQVK